MELWKAFWIYFVFGHGIVMGLGLGLIVIAMTIGLAFLPSSLDAGFLDLMIAGSVLGLFYLVFATWVSISVWRAANNCVNRCWVIGARFTMIVYASCLILPVFWWRLEHIN